MEYHIIYEELKKINQSVILDGEIVVMDKNDLSSFQKLQDYANNTEFPIFYYVFDLLYYRGKDIRNRPLIERKSLLQQVLKRGSIIRYCDHIIEYGEDFFGVAVEKGLEGIIAKQIKSPYLTGIRSDMWQKIRNTLIEEVVIAGFTKPRGSRKRFGALILGRYNGKGELEYTGHTGTGFTEKKLEELYHVMVPLIQEKSPFNKKIPVNNTATWLKPKLVCNIKFTEWTKDGSKRHPVYQGLRLDKTAREVKTEQ